MLRVFCEHACKKLQLFLCVQAGFNAFILRQFSHVWSWHQRYTANAIWTNLHLLFRSKSFLTSFIKFKLFVPVNTRKHLLNNFNNWRRLAIQNLQKQQQHNRLTSSVKLIDRKIKLSLHKNLISKTIQDYKLKETSFGRVFHFGKNVGAKIGVLKQRDKKNFNHFLA